MSLCFCSKPNKFVEKEKTDIKKEIAEESYKEQKEMCIFIDTSVPIKGYFREESKLLNIFKKIWDNSVFGDLNCFFNRNNLFGFGSEVEKLSISNINEIMKKFTMKSSDIRVAVDYIKENQENIKCDVVLFISDLVTSQSTGVNDVFEYSKSLSSFVQDREYGLWLIGVMAEYYGVALKNRKGLYYFSETKDNRGGWVEINTPITKPIYFLIVAKRDVGRKLFFRLRDNLEKIYEKETIKSTEIFPHNIDNDRLEISCVPNPKEVIITNRAKYTKDQKLFDDNIRLICKSEKTVNIKCYLNLSKDSFDISNRQYDLQFVYDKTYIDIKYDNSKEEVESIFYLPFDLQINCSKIEDSYSKAKSGSIKVSFSNEFNKDNISWWNGWSTDDDYKEFDKTLYFYNLMKNLFIANKAHLEIKGKGIEYKIWR